MRPATRRQFLGGLQRVVGGAAAGLLLAGRSEAACWLLRPLRERLRFGALDPLVDLLQETPADALLPLLVARLRGGTSLADLVAAGALANARAHGGTNYDGYHALMAMVPGYEMAAQLPPQLAPLPVLKVLHRNARFIAAAGRTHDDALWPLDDAPFGDAPSDNAPGGNSRGEAARSTAGGDHVGGDLVGALRARELSRAEHSLALAERQSRLQAYERLQVVVRDDGDVHRVVLAWRAWDLARLTGDGDARALTLLRQPVHYCISADEDRARRGQGSSELQGLLPGLLAEHGLGERERGSRRAEDAWIERLADTVYGSERAAAASAVAAALAEGFDPEDAGAALSLAAARLLLHDPGQDREQPGRPLGSVHGATVGVHAGDAANAWRHIARLGSAENAHASLVAGAWHTAGQARWVGGQPFDAGSEPCTLSDGQALLGGIEAAIRARDQVAACGIARRYTGLGLPPGELFACLLGFALSEDGALHAEKYFRTAQEAHALARPAHRATFLVALTRVMASHFGFPAPGVAEARELLET